MSTEDAVAAYQHADDQAKRLQQQPNECRTRAPIHSDLCSEWLRGVGTPSAAQTKVFLTIPVQLLTGGDVAATLPDPETLLPEPQAELVGRGPIDSLTAWACGGKTNIDELRPLCPRDHVNQHRTRAVYCSRPDRTVEVTTPTGFRTSPPGPVAALF